MHDHIAHAIKRTLRHVELPVHTRLMYYAMLDAGEYIYQRTQATALTRMKKGQCLDMMP